ncbi:MAG: 30S ribosomal protein S21 [Planctomycetota bacterium]
MPVKVVVRHNEPIDKALKRFKKMCNMSGIFKEARRNKEFEKPSEKRRRKEKERLKNIRKYTQQRERRMQRRRKKRR